MIEPLEHAPAGVLAFKAIGKLGIEDYRQVLRPAIDREVAAGRKIRLVAVLGPECEGYAHGPEWEAERPGLAYLRKLKRCAIVSDQEWVTRQVKRFAWMLGGRVKLFAPLDLPAALHWAASG
jgi:hypothetical protein